MPARRTHLQKYGIKLLVVACNTASAVALEAMRQQMHPLPVIGVVEPGVLRLLATDGATRFSRVGGRFLGERLATSDIELVDL